MGSSLNNRERENISMIMFYMGLLTLAVGTRLCAGTPLLRVKFRGQDMSS